ncbi:MAG: TOMM precursor leader peptide-binding protein [Gammaproteobacteria bacterium]|nr:TOMM precursor leader peptide-binding protein [Gammaproteobacteria bacterium]
MSHNTQEDAESHQKLNRGILRKVDAADLGVIEMPALTPHLEFREIGDGQVLLVSELFNTLLRGSIHSDLLPLLDGSRSHHDIVAALSGTYSKSNIRTALAALASRGYVVSGDYALERESAAFWSSLGASPRWAEKRLAASKISMTGDEGNIARRLDAAGVTIDADGPTLSVVVCKDYLEQMHEDINRRHIESGVPWMLVRPKGIHPLFGPIFRPAEQGPCWACLAYRLRGHQEVHNFLRNFAGADAAFLPGAADPTVLDAIYGLAATEIAKWLVLEEMAPLHAQAISIDTIRLKSEHHQVMRRPQCFTCGDERLYRADRPPEPVRLKPSPKDICNSGGVRSVPPEKTLAKYQRLISPVSGVVSWVARTTEETDPWLHVYWAGSNFALRSSELNSLRRSLRSKSAGKGSTPRQSEASALCEAIERYSGAFHGDEIRCRRRLADFLKAGESEAIHPNDVQLFSDQQLNNAEQLNARGHPYNFVPARFDPDAEVDWSPVWSLTQGRHRYLPTSMLYGMLDEQRGNSGLKADSNGCAAGNTLEEAILQGFLELIERDAFAVWWYNRLRLPGVDLESFGDDYLASAQNYYGGFNREMWVLDVTHDFGIPTFVAVSRRTDEGEEDIIYGAGAHLDPHIAALRAVCELNQFLNWAQGSERGGCGHDVDEPLCRWWWKNGKLGDHPYLMPASDVSLRGKSDYPIPDTADVREDVERCRALVEAKGLEFLVLDQTRPDIGMPVARVIVPGLRHFWERFAPGRLFDVPVEMEWRESPVEETDLNPIPVIA